MMHGIRLGALSTLFLASALARGGAAQCGSWHELPGTPQTQNLAQFSYLYADRHTNTLYAIEHCYCGYHGAANPRVLRWTGSTWESLGGYDLSNDGIWNGLAVFDLGDGPALYSWGDINDTEGVRRWNGTTWNMVSPYVPTNLYQVEVFDDGTGPAFYIESNGIRRNVGTTWQLVGGANVSYAVLCSHDDGTGTALYASGAFTSIGGVPVNRVARWNGSTWSAADAGLGAVQNVYTLTSVREESGPALYARVLMADGRLTIERWDGTSWTDLGAGLPTGITAIQGITSYDRGTGSGPGIVVTGTRNGGPPFCVQRIGSTWSPLPNGPGGGALQGPLAVADVDGIPGDDLVALRPAGQTTLAGYLQGCGESGRTDCLGDGSTVACPCGNQSAPAERAGCASSLGIGGALRGRGTSALVADSAVLEGAAMTNSSVLYVQGASSHAAVPFGDGLKCTGGPFVRLGTKQNVGGASRFPDAGDQPLAERGHVVAPGTRHYQARYRNSAPFCTNDTFNYTNSVTLVWSL